MAVLQRHKSTVFGLVTDLAQLQTNINNEATARGNADTTLQTNIDTEATARANADTTLQTNINNEATARGNADTALGGRVDDVNTAVGLVGDAYVAPVGTNYLGTATSVANAAVLLDAQAKANADAVVAEATARANGDTAARSYADDILAAFVGGDFATLNALVGVINSDSTVEGSFRKAIADVVASAPEALDTLNEIAAYINVNGTGDDVLTAITNSITAAKAEIRGEVTAAYDTLGEVEAALNIINGSSTTAGSIAKVEADYIAADSAITTAYQTADTTLQNNINAEATARATADTTLQTNINNEATARANADTTLTNGLANLSGVTDAATARSNIGVYSTSEVDSAIANGGAIFITEILTVGADAITLTHEPKNGMIFNFATVRHTDANFVSYDIPVTVGASAKVYNLSPNSSGEFDGKAVVVQYAYTPSV